MIDWFDILAVQGTLKSLLHYHISKALVRHAPPGSRQFKFLLFLASIGEILLNTELPWWLKQ